MLHHSLLQHFKDLILILQVATYFLCFIHIFLMLKNQLASYCIPFQVCLMTISHFKLIFRKIVKLNNYRTYVLHITELQFRV